MLLDGALAHLECDRFATLPGGDHTIVIGRVIGGTTGDGRPLLYYRGGYGVAGMTGPACGSRPLGTELLDDPAADPETVARSLRQRRARQPLVRRRRGRAPRGGAGAARRAVGPHAHAARPGHRCRRPAAARRRAGRADGDTGCGRSGSSGAGPRRRLARRGGRPLRRRPAPAHRRCAAKSVDIVLVSQVAHHLTRDSAIRLLRTCDALARVGVVVADLRRGAARAARVLVRLSRPPLRSDHPGRRPDLDPARLHRRRAARTARSGGRRGTVSRRPGYRLVATWLTRRALMRTVDRIRMRAPAERGLRRRRRRGALARDPAPLPLGADAGAPDGRRAWSRWPPGGRSAW